MNDRFPHIGSFARMFAVEYKGFMNDQGIRGAQIAAALGRGEAYISERVNGKRSLDADDVDALASLVDGWDGVSLMLELSRRTQATMGSISDTETPHPVSRSSNTHPQGTSTAQEATPANLDTKVRNSKPERLPPESGSTGDPFYDYLG